MSRPLSEITQFIQELGHDFAIDLQRPEQPIRHGDFKGHAWVKNLYIREKHIIVVGIYDHKTTEYARETFTDSKDPLTTAELKKLTKELERADHDYQEQKKKDNEECQSYCQKEWESAKPCDTHPYLSKKGVRPNGQLKVRSSIFPGKSELLCGAWDNNGTFWGYQCIGDTKSFPPGFKLSGSFCNLGSDFGTNPSCIVICEGVSTALSIAESLEYKFPVVACFGAGNLVAVAIALREKYGKTPIKICADNDCWKPDSGNAGVMAGQKAVSAIDGAALIVPDFSGCDQSGKPTDFNDLHRLQGLDEVKKQIEAVNPDRPEYIYSLGFADKTYFFTTLRTAQVQGIGEFTSSDLLKLTSINYWKRLYPGARGGVDWESAKSTLIAECQKAGLFEHNKVKGRGIYINGDDLIIHIGDKLIVNGVSMEIQDYESTIYFDPRGKVELPEKAILTESEFKRAEKLIGDLPFDNQSDSKLLMGWMMLAPLAGALSWRPHIMLTAAAGSGKSTIINHIIEPSFSFLKPAKHDDITEAGLRQKIRADAAIVILDEFDSNKKDTGKLDRLLTYARSACSEGEMGRGTPSGKSLSYTARSIFLFSGINPPKLEEADNTRITEITLSKFHKRESWKEFKHDLETFFPKIGAKIFWTGVERVRALNSSAEVLHEVLSPIPDVGPRVGQQLGTLLAGYWHWKSAEVITDAQARSLVEEFISQKTLGAEISGGKSQNTDAENCYNHLMDLPIFYGAEKRRILLAEFIALTKPVTDEKNEYLLTYGMLLKDGGLFVPSSNPELERHFEKTVWKTWAKTLLRIPKTRKDAVKRGGFRRGVNVPCQTVPDDF